MHQFISFLVISITFFGCSQSHSDSSKTEISPVAKGTLQAIVKEHGFLKKNLSVHIDKSDYTFQVLHKDTVVVTYPCVLGFNPVDDKHQEGDGCTPEGEFKIRSMYPHRSWSYFIWIDYPTKESWRRFKERKAEGIIESGGTIGGEIGIHGVPVGSNDLISSKRNWTYGCISLTTENITDVYKSIGPSTKITIVP